MYDPALIVEGMQTDVTVGKGCRRGPPSMLRKSGKYFTPKAGLLYEEFNPSFILAGLSSRIPDR
jgi:hypothetical protein